MSYCMQQRSQQFVLRPDSKVKALEAIKNAANEKAERRNASHHDQSFAEEMNQTKTLEEAIVAWGWQLDDLGDGDYRIECLGNGLGDDHRLFEAIAPFVVAGSFIEMSGEDGTIWRWYFDGKQCEEQLGRVVYGEQARVLVAVQGGMADYDSTGDVDVALVDYDVDKQAEIPEGFENLHPS